jgi:hypothetical protein
MNINTKINRIETDSQIIENLKTRAKQHKKTRQHTHTNHNRASHTKTFPPVVLHWREAAIGGVSDDSGVLNAPDSTFQFASALPLELDRVAMGEMVAAADALCALYPSWIFVSQLEELVYAERVYMQRLQTFLPSEDDTPGAVGDWSAITNSGMQDLDDPELIVLY